MFAAHSIRRKIWIMLGVLLVMVGLISYGGIYGMYAYRSLVRTLSRRVAELPVANQLSHDVSDLRVALSQYQTIGRMTFDGMRDRSSHQMVKAEFSNCFHKVEYTLNRYRSLIALTEDGNPIGDNSHELRTVDKIETLLQSIRWANRSQDWWFDNIQIGRLQDQLEQLQELSSELPSYLHGNIAEFTEEIKGQYRALIVLGYVLAVTTLLMLGVSFKLFYSWVSSPLHTLIAGSRRVASGDFEFRIRLCTHDEMEELANSMNHMTERFLEIRNNLDQKVQERTSRVVRSEQMASVGFLAAGVAHEINNPLAAIALGADAIEVRLLDMLTAGEPRHDAVRKYLKMIQDEAFRCKDITMKLLDFSRMGDLKRLPTDIGELIDGVINMIGHLGKYQDKRVELRCPQKVIAEIDPQQIKQVLLNLLVNGLDASHAEGVVCVDVKQVNQLAEITIIDHGCGMTAEVLKHLFEPFFTRSRSGQGTGLGLSIAYSIVSDHDGVIEVASDGPNQGATFIVRLPLHSQPEVSHRYAKVA